MTRLLVTVLVFFVATPAYATPSSPGIVQSALGLATTPDCSTCHASGFTGSGTATTPFAVSLRSRGFIAGNADSLRTALQALEAEQTDSDGDGVGDIDELRAGTSPNLAPGESEVTYGCGANVGGLRRGYGVLWTCFIAGFAVLLLNRRRR